ncbi:unnamed protein product [Symbiodinium natans]|uniref:OTU domain-containing protein n=1 Tax=Symbiodinium natans TaxID=878477 RepID=A0A812PU81_9DINO|nr:unnamed protein product [Symbiodinium natans]
MVLFKMLGDGNCFWRAVMCYTNDIGKGERFTAQGEPWLRLTAGPVACRRDGWWADEVATLAKAKVLPFGTPPCKFVSKQIAMLALRFQIWGRVGDAQRPRIFKLACMKP